MKSPMINTDEEEEDDTEDELELKTHETGDCIEAMRS